MHWSIILFVIFFFSSQESLLFFSSHIFELLMKSNPKRCLTFYFSFLCQHRWNLTKRSGLCAKRQMRGEGGGDKVPETSDSEMVNPSHRQ